MDFPYPSLKTSEPYTFPLEKMYYPLTWMTLKPLIFIALLLPVLLIGQSARRGTAVERMRELLSLQKDNRPLTPEVLAKSDDGELTIEDLRFNAGKDVWVPAIIVKPRAASNRLPAIICLPGTGGTRQQLADARLQLSERPRTGWARALARQGFVTISLDYRGSPARGQNIYTEAVQSQLEGRSYMGLLVYETMRAVDYLLTRPDVDPARIGITGFSLGGAVSWYAAAADPRLSVIAPVCGGAGT